MTVFLISVLVSRWAGLASYPCPAMKVKDREWDGKFPVNWVIRFGHWQPDSNLWRDFFQQSNSKVKIFLFTS